MQKQYLFILLNFIFLTQFILAQNNINDFANIKNVNFIPQQANDTGIYFSSKGAWFGFSLPQISDTENLGAFGGPFNIYNQKWMAKKLIASEINIKNKGKVNLSEANKINIAQLPGSLLQEYSFSDFVFKQRLVNVSSKSYICVSEFINSSNSTIPVNMSYKGQLFDNIGEGQELKNGWAIKLKNENDGFFTIQFRVEGSLELAYNEQEYNIEFKNFVPLNAGDTLRLVATISHYFQGDNNDDIKTVHEAIDDFEKPFSDNDKYWGFYIEKLKQTNPKMQKIAINALQTIWQNYKIQSTNYNNHWFTKNNCSPLWELSLNDVYATTICLTLLEPKLAANQVSNFLNWFSDSTKQRLHNEFYFKEDKNKEHSFSDFNILPWITWNIFAIDTTAIPLLDNTIAEFQNINDYLYLAQDNNSNWFCENNNNIESVKKNAAIFSELLSFKKILQVLKINNLNIYNQKINYMTQFFDKYFYDEFTNMYCDIDYHSNKMYENQNAFPFVIWSGLGAFTSVEKYINSNYINYQVNEDNSYFFEKENLFLNFFLLSGLYNYKYNNLLQDIRTKVIEKIEKEVTKNNNEFFIYDNGEKINNSTFAAEMLLILMLYF